jgi:hypothetical protein
MEVHATCTGDAFGKEASEKPHRAGLLLSALFELARATGIDEGQGST